MKVLLVQADGKWPNLPLMKLSTSHKRMGDQVFLGCCESPDQVYVSCVFTKNRDAAYGMARFYPEAEIFFGGSGFNLSSKLPDEIEHEMPDYALYGIDYSIGFTSRGCIRNCPWCIVPQKEGQIREHSQFEEFVHLDHSKVLLLDNNFLASPNCVEKLNWLHYSFCKVSFNQGLDIRLVTEEIAGLLADVKYCDGDFNERRLYFSFDQPAILEQVKKGIDFLNSAGIKSSSLMFYFLCNFNTTFEEEQERFKTLLDLGVDPFCMNYGTPDAERLDFARYVNSQRCARKMSFQEFRERGL